MRPAVAAGHVGMLRLWGDLRFAMSVGKEVRVQLLWGILSSLS